MRTPKLSLVAAAAIPLVVAVVGCGSSSQSGSSSSGASSEPASVKDAQTYIKDMQGDIGRVRANVQVVLIDVGQAQSGNGDVNKVAQDAQQAHDNLDGIRSDFAKTTTTSGRLGDAEVELFTAANDLKNSMGALVAYTGDPNPATLAHFTTQYQNARDEWDHGVRVVWSAAHEHPAPTLEAP